MSHSISTLLTRNLHEVFGEGDPRRRAAINDIFTEDCVFYSLGAFTGAETRLIESRARSGRPIRTSSTRPRPHRRNCMTPVASDGCQAGLARHRPMPEPTSSSLAMAGSLPFTSSSTHSFLADNFAKKVENLAAALALHYMHCKAQAGTSAEIQAAWGICRNLEPQSRYWHLDAPLGSVR